MFLDLGVVRRDEFVGISRIMKPSMPKYSIVVPLHNEQENVTDLYDRLKAVMEASGESFELSLIHI